MLRQSPLLFLHLRRMMKADLLQEDLQLHQRMCQVHSARHQVHAGYLSIIRIQIFQGMTTDLSDWYAPAMLTTVAIVLAMTLWCVRAALGGRTLLKADLLD